MQKRRGEARGRITRVHAHYPEHESHQHVRNLPRILMFGLLPMVERPVKESRLEMVMVTIHKMNVVIDHALAAGGQQHDIRFDRSGRVDNEARTQPAVVAHGASHHGAIRDRQFAMRVPGTEW